VPLWSESNEERIGGVLLLTPRMPCGGRLRLLAAASVANDRINFTCRTSSQNNLGAARGPIRFELVRRCGKWDKKNRSSLELCPTGVDLPRSEPETELLPPETKIQLEENNPSGLQLLGV